MIEIPLVATTTHRQVHCHPEKNSFVKRESLVCGLVWESCGNLLARTDISQLISRVWRVARPMKCQVDTNDKNLRLMNLRRSQSCPRGCSMNFNVVWETLAVGDLLVCKENTHRDRWIHVKQGNTEVALTSTDKG